MHLQVRSMSSVEITEIPDRIIRPKRGLIGVNFGELWRYRELFFFLSWRDVLIRYKQTALGVLWVILQPLASVVVFTVIFGKMANLDSNGAPYPLLTLAALIPWQMFSNAVGASSLSLISSANLVTKIYFPRLIIPLSSTLGTLVDSLVGILLLLLFVVGYVLGRQLGLIDVAPNVGFHWQIVLMPIFFAYALLTAIACGLWFSALNVQYRDVKYVIPFMLRIAMLVSPVGYLSSEISDSYRLLYSINPLVGVIDGFRWSVLGSEFQPFWPGFWVGTLVVLFFLVTGVMFFRNTERKFADII